MTPERLADTQISTPGAHPGSGADPEATRAVEAGTLASLPGRSRLSPGEGSR